MNLDSPPPREDSPDLTDQEIEAAIICTKSSEIATILQGVTCEICHQQMTKYHYEVRRRDNYLYWRILITCQDRHKSTTIIVRADWLRGDT